jgi:DNA-binding response OmpR family regulator
VTEPTPESLPKAPTILLVADDSAASAAPERLLEDAGYVVQLATDMAALVRVDVRSMDLTLLDLESTRLDGLRLCRWLRAYQTALYLPIIALTASSDSPHRHACFGAGVDDVVSRACESEELLDRVEVWVRTRRRLAAAQEGRVQQAHLANDTLTGVLTTVQSILQRWAAVYYPPDDARQVHMALQQAATDVGAALEKLASTVPNESGGYTEYYLPTPKRR